MLALQEDIRYLIQWGSGGEGSVKDNNNNPEFRGDEQKLIPSEY